MNQDTSVSKYVRFCKSLNDKGVLVQADELSDLIDPNKDSYASTYYYNQKQYDQFKETGTIRGIKDVVTDRIWFDFDSEKDVSLAQKDALTVIERLQKYGIKSNNIEVYFSGNRGFEVTVRFNRMLTPEQVQSLAINKFGKDLSTLDISLYDNSQILRLPFTRHQKSGLFKIPLDTTQLKKLNIDEIKKLAFSLDTAIEVETEQASPSEEFFYIDVSKKEEVKHKVNLGELDLTRIPKHWRTYKWALLHAVGVKPEERHDALLRISATCKGLGYSEDITRAFCLTFDENFQRLTGKPAVEDLETNILPTVFSDSWQGGQYSYKTDIWLQKYCERVGLVPKDDIDDLKIVDVDNIVDAFDDYALNFEKNIVKTGVKDIDDNILFLTSTHSGILGQPGSGKTSFAIQWLRNISKTGEQSIFYSLDMAKPIIAGKLIQSIKGCSFKEAINLRVSKPKEYDQVVEHIREEYKNVSFNFTSGTTVDQIKQDVKKQEEITGKKIRLVMVDYLECLQGQFSDPTANSGLISNQLKDLASELNVCSILLLQTQKHGGDVSDPLLSMKKIKGSSLVEQSMSVVMTLWRPGYEPKYADRDDFISFAAVKNRFGGLWTGDFSWNGKKGQVGQALSDEERQQLQELLDEKKKDKDALNDSSWS